MLMLCAFLAWLVATVIEARNQRSAAEEVLGAQRAWVAAASCVGGLAFLIVAGYGIVSGARGIALQFGVAEFIIGATVVAVGTDSPADRGISTQTDPVRLQGLARKANE